MTDHTAFAAAVAELFGLLYQWGLAFVVCFALWRLWIFFTGR